MNKAPMLTLSSAFFMVVPPVHAGLNLVQDPDFEGGEAGVLGFASTPWFSPDGNGDISINGSNPQSGSFNAVMSSTGQSALLYQQLVLRPDMGYSINFWIANPGANGGMLMVGLNGAPSAAITVAGNSAYTEYVLTATPVNSSGNLEFLWTSTSSATLDVDNVSVAVPEPTTMVAGTMMLLPFAKGSLRQRKKVAA